MSVKQLGQDYRSAMRELVKGFLEHCEHCTSYMGRIDHFVWQDGLKYGMPTFTLLGGVDEAGASQTVNILGRNVGNGAKIAEGILQVIERVILQPRVARGFNLRLMPVSDPIALEGVISCEASSAAINELVESWKFVAPDGNIEIGEIDGDLAQIRVSGDDRLFRSVLDADETLWKRYGAHWTTVVEEFRAEIVARDGWEIRIGLPGKWDAGISSHMLCQFLLTFMAKNRDHRYKGQSVGKFNGYTECRLR